MLKNTHAEPRNPSALESFGCATFLVIVGLSLMYVIDWLTKVH